MGIKQKSSIRSYISRDFFTEMSIFNKMVLEDSF
jgi:hypothetical protein